MPSREGGSEILIARHRSREVQRDLGKLTEAVEGLRRDIAAIGEDTRQGLSNMGRRVDEVVDQIGELRADGASRGAQIASIQAKIEEEIEQYERRKWWGRVFNSFMGWVIFVCGLAVLCGIGYLVYLFGPPIVDFIARKLGMK